MRSPLLNVTINLDQIRVNAETVRNATRVPLIAVVKADAYGLGADAVIDVLASVADEFAFFSLREARRVGRGGLVVGPPLGRPDRFREYGLRPTIWTPAHARRFSDQAVALSVDTGMQRFGCRPEQIDSLLKMAPVEDVFTHAASLASVQRLTSAAGRSRRRLHAASTSLLHEPQAWLDAVRPGYALYRGALHVATSLVEARDTSGRVGYTGFESPRVGVILGGYSNGLRPAPVFVNGRRQRLLEIGMNTSFISLDAADRSGDRVVLLGEGLSESDVAAALGVRPHEVLCAYAAMGPRRYISASPTQSPPAGTTRAIVGAPRRI